MRGDHLLVRIRHQKVSGSSSHAWGPLRCGYRSLWGIRFILTCVGTTRHILSGIPNVAVHPHMRGDHLPTLVYPSVLSGSSSHAWGPRRKVRNFIFPARFILTCVGTTTQGTQLHHSSAVHPHMRGDHCSERAQVSIVSGSSSHAWGPHLITALPY